MQAMLAKNTFTAAVNQTYKAGQTAQTRFNKSLINLICEILSLTPQIMITENRLEKGPTKTHESLQKKHQRTNSKTVTDACRSRIYTNGPKEMETVIKAFKKLFKNAGHNKNRGILHLSADMRINLNTTSIMKNHVERPKEWGYQGLIITVEVKTPHQQWRPAEIQISDVSMKETLKETHRLYATVKSEVEEYTAFRHAPESYIANPENFYNKHGQIDAGTYFTHIRSILYPEIEAYENYMKTRNAFQNITLQDFCEWGLDTTEQPKQHREENAEKQFNHIKRSFQKHDHPNGVNAYVQKTLETMIDLWKISGEQAGLDRLWEQDFPKIEGTETPKKENTDVIPLPRDLLQAVKIAEPA